MNYWILILWWLAFSIVHSLLAARFIKSKLQPFFGKYYRLSYGLVSLVLLVGALRYQFGLSSTYLFEPFFGILPFLIVGVLIMILCIKKYFLYLSGVDALMKAPVDSRLETSGLHRFVRHPLYFGTLLTGWSWWFLMPSVAHLVGLCMITGYTIAGTFLEEKKLRIEYGDQYIRYQQSVPMLLPYKLFNRSKI